MTAVVAAGRPVRLLLAGPERLSLVRDSYCSMLPGYFRARGIHLASLQVVHCDDYTGVDLNRVDPGATDLIVLNASLPSASWSGLHGLRTVTKLGRLRPGVEVADLDAAGVSYLQVPDLAYAAVAEHAIMLMLASGHRLADSSIQPGGARDRHASAILTSQNHRRTNWRGLDGRRLRQLYGACLGIVGLGEIGYELAARARAFGMTVIYHNRNRLSASVEQELGLRPAGKGELLRSADFVVVTATVAATGGPILSRSDIEHLRAGSTVVNISRGTAVDEQALIDTVRAGRLQGIGLDVYTVEPVDPASFARCDNTYLTAHAAGVLAPERRFADWADWIAGASAEHGLTTQDRGA
jgi:glyoxylate/hydroxypyruvate/2-ketogluconate reductase